MVKVQAPALSMEASGKLGGCMVFSSWKGRAYVRSLVKPTNPKTALQTGIRAAMKFLAQIWTTIAAPNQAYWNTLAANANISPFNAFVAENMRNWRNGFGLAPAPAATHEGGPCVMSELTATGAARHAAISLAAAAWTDEWATILCRSTTTGFTPTWANCIVILPLTGSSGFTYIDSGLDADTYYYRAATCDLNGAVGVYFAEQDAIVS
jgi:hypothetical protein